MKSAFAQDTYNEAKEIWRGWSEEQIAPREHIVPFCTPIIPNPDVVIVGLNHARFDDKPDSAWGQTNDGIAEDFAKAPPTVNTFSMHDHQYAKNLRATIERATGRIFPKRDPLTRALFRSWLGTNRCSVQCHQRGEEVVRKRLKKDSLFRASQENMDSFLRHTIERMSPRYVLLCGRFAIDVFEDIFVAQSDVAVKDMRPEATNEITFVPMLHLSYAPHMKSNAEKLKQVGETLGWQDL